MEIKFGTETSYIEIIRNHYSGFIQWYDRDYKEHRLNKPDYVSTFGVKTWYEEGEPMGHCFCSSTTSYEECNHPWESIKRKLYSI